MSASMHKYCWNSEGLSRALDAFIGGQCQIESQAGSKSPGTVYRGQVRSFRVHRGNLLVIAFEWLRMREFVIDSHELIQNKWVLAASPPSGPPFLNFYYSIYYPQVDEGRLKLKGYGEICRFYKKDDYTNLIQVGEDDFLPYCMSDKGRLFRQVAVAMLVKSKH